MKTVCMGTRFAYACVAVAVLAFGFGSTVSARRDAPVTLRIEKLSGSIERIGSTNSPAFYEVRLLAAVCLGSSFDAGNTYVREVRITHYAVTRRKTRWWAARTVIDRAPALVPIGETWHGKACGKLVFEDPIPPEHYGVESLGNTTGCYGVALTIKAGGTQASRRAIVKCGRRFG